MNWNGVEIDERMALVIESIRQHDGRATTTDVKQDTPFEHNNSVKYRFRQLEEVGVVDIEDQGIDEETGRRLPLLVELTDDGQELVEKYDIHADSVREQQDIEERVRTLEAKVDKVRDDMWDLKSDLRGLCEDVDRILDVVELRDPGGDSGGGVFDGVDSEELEFGE